MLQPLSVQEQQWKHGSPALHGSRRFITAFTKARHWSLPWVSWIQSTLSHHIFQDPFKYYPPVYAYGSQVVPSPSGFLDNILYAILISPCMLYDSPIQPPLILSP